MADEKKYTAQEAAQAVLKKAEEMLKAHSKHIGWDKLESKLEGEGYSKKVADKINGSIKAKVEKSEDVVDQKRADGGEKSADKKADKDAGLKKSFADDNSKKANAKPSEHDSKDAGDSQGKAPKGEINPKEHVEGEPGKVKDRVEGQKAPQDNPKENAEGNNEKAGTTPTQVGEDQKNKPGFDEMKGLMKLAKFMGRMEHKKSQKVEAK